MGNDPRRRSRTGPYVGAQGTDIQRVLTMTNCDTCGVRVSTKGYLGGGIVCHTCSEYKRTGDVDALRQRIDRYGGGKDWDEAEDIQELVY